MLRVERSELPIRMQPGRKCNTAVEPTLPGNQSGLMVSFAHFSYVYGKMDTHRHQNEYMYVVEAKDAVVSHGMDLENLITEDLHAGEIIRPVNGEWHRFDFTSDDGYVLFVNFFADAPPRTVNAADLGKEA